jgi:thiosulfate dehydrogenase
MKLLQRGQRAALEKSRASHVHMAASFFLMCLPGMLLGCEESRNGLAPAAAMQAVSSQEVMLMPLQAPDASTIPATVEGEKIRRGKYLLEHTVEELPENVGNGLHCTSCHLEAGTKANAAPWIGVRARYPKYRARSGTWVTLEKRINDCFERSMNGKALATEDAAMGAMVAYMDWLSAAYEPGTKVEGQGIPRLVLDRQPDLKRGEMLYAQKCSACHGVSGEGLSPNGAYAFPALWGEHSYNIGAGMARLYTAAGFIKHNMPLGAGGTLSDDEAFDIAGYFAFQPRPDFPGKAKDWPKGKRPSDARY